MKMLRFIVSIALMGALLATQTAYGAQPAEAFANAPDLVRIDMAQPGFDLRQRAARDVAALDLQLSSQGFLRHAAFFSCCADVVSELSLVRLIHRHRSHSGTFYLTISDFRVIIAPI